MSTYSQSDLATRVLRDLGIYAPDEVPSDDDIQDVIETIASETAGMAVRGIGIVNGSDQSLPLEYLSALSRRMGLAVGPSFGVFKMAEAAVAIPAAELYLRQISAKSPTGEPVEQDYF